MRRVTAFDEWRRGRTGAWLNSVMEDWQLTETVVAREMLDPEHRAYLKSLGGATKESQDAPRKKIKAWREQRQTINANNAYALGEALGNVGVPGTSGFHVAFRLGFGSDIAGALIALGRSDHPKSRLAAFTIYAVLPRHFLDAEHLADDSLWRESLQSPAAASTDSSWRELSELTKVNSTRAIETKTRSLRDCDSLLKLALTAVAEVSASSWKGRHSVPGSLGRLVASLAQQEIEYRRSFGSETELVKPITRAWQQLYFDWGLATAYKLRLALTGGLIEMALLAITNPSIRNTQFDQAWDELSSTLRERFNVSRSKGKGTR